MRAMKMVSLVIAAVLAVGASVAVADISGPLTFETTGSWTISQGWYHYVPWDTYVLKITGDVFEAPYAALTGTWTLVESSADTRIYKRTTGLSDTVYGTIYGAGSPIASTKLELIAYNGTQWVGTDAYSAVPYNTYLGCDERNANGSISIGYGKGEYSYAEATQSVVPIPAPAAIVLGMVGLGLLGWVKRRVA